MRRARQRPHRLEHDRLAVGMAVTQRRVDVARVAAAVGPPGDQQRRQPRRVERSHGRRTGEPKSMNVSPSWVWAIRSCSPAAIPRSSTSIRSASRPSPAARASPTTGRPAPAARRPRSRWSPRARPHGDRRLPSDRVASAAAGACSAANRATVAVDQLGRRVDAAALSDARRPRRRPSRRQRHRQHRAAVAVRRVARQRGPGERDPVRPGWPAARLAVHRRRRPLSGHPAARSPARAAPRRTGDGSARAPGTRRQ